MLILGGPGGNIERYGRCNLFFTIFPRSKQSPLLFFWIVSVHCSVLLFLTPYGDLLFRIIVWFVCSVLLLFIGTRFVVRDNRSRSRWLQRIFRWVMTAGIKERKVILFGLKKPMQRDCNSSFRNLVTVESTVVALVGRSYKFSHHHLNDRRPYRAPIMLQFVDCLRSEPLQNRIWHNLTFCFHRFNTGADLPGGNFYMRMKYGRNVSWRCTRRRIVCVHVACCVLHSSSSYFASFVTFLKVKSRQWTLPWQGVTTIPSVSDSPSVYNVISSSSECTFPHQKSVWLMRLQYSSSTP